MSLVRALRGILRRDVLLICAVIFMADLVTGILSPTFSLFAKGLGASLALIGILGSLVGLTQLFTAMPIGTLSDRYGRKVVLIFGMLAFAVATALYALSPNPWWLIPGRILFGVAGISTFSMGAAYVGDIVRPEERGLAFGLYTTAMGLGFAIGPLLGSVVASQYGIAGSYWVASGLAVTGAALAAWGLRKIVADQGGVKTRRIGLDLGETLRLLRDPNLLAASIGNLLTSVTFSGVVTNFFPVYVAQLGASQAAINSMFSARAFGSTMMRLPTGGLITRFSSRLMIIAALVLTTISIVGLTQTSDLWWLALFITLEGVAFGAFLTSGQTFVTEHAAPALRGRAIGAYSTTGSLGSTFSPLLLGLVAEIWGITAVFRLTLALMILGLTAVIFLYTRRVAPTLPDAEPDPQPSGR